jgi:hypothetical protein
MNTIFKKGKKAVKRNGNIMAELVSRVTFIHPEKNNEQGRIKKGARMKIRLAFCLNDNFFHFSN